MKDTFKLLITTLGGFCGWFVAEFRPTFPLILIAIIFILYDAYTAYRLDVRVHAKYPEKTKAGKVHFTSFAFGKVVKSTIPKRLGLILLAFLVENWVFVFMNLPLSYIACGIICFEQFWSILENESSCNTDKESRFWKLIERITIDKTSRHFNVDLSGFGNKESETNNTNNQDEIL